MKRAIVVLFVFAIAVPAQAQEERTRSRSRTLTGGVLILGGIGLVYGAFNFRYVCDGYSSTAGSGLDAVHYCTTIYGGRAYTRETPLYVDLARKPLLYTGAGAIVLGTLLSTVWADVPIARDLDIRAGPGEFQVGKTFGF